MHKRQDWQPTVKSFSTLPEKFHIRLLQWEEIYIKMQTASKASDHIGMSNVYKRLNLLYGDLGKMTVESNEKCGFIVEVSFPKTAKCKMIIR